MLTYIINAQFEINCGFDVSSYHMESALYQTNNFLETIPSTVYKNIDYKTTSSIVGSMFCHAIANVTEAVVNPIEKGHPDLIPKVGENDSEELLRNYPTGLEIKCTVGNIAQGVNLRPGHPRVGFLKGITWQAHHREVNKLLGLVWDFFKSDDDFNYPKITAIFYSDNLIVDDGGKISGITGKNTKVTGMRFSGKMKMGSGWIALINEQQYIDVYQRIMRFAT